MRDLTPFELLRLVPIIEETIQRKTLVNPSLDHKAVTLKAKTYGNEDCAVIALGICNNVMPRIGRAFLAWMLFDMKTSELIEMKIFRQNSLSRVSTDEARSSFTSKYLKIVKSLNGQFENETVQSL